MGSSMNVAKKANDIIIALNLMGFNGIKVADIEKEGIWHQEYAIFTINFRFPLTGFWDEEETQYIKPKTFDYRQFTHDFVTWLKKEFPNCNLKYYPECHEVEICGPNYKQFYEQNMDALEDLAEKPGHQIYEYATNS
jgi:hypothetical protein